MRNEAQRTNERALQSRIDTAIERHADDYNEHGAEIADYNANFRADRFVSRIARIELAEDDREYLLDFIRLYLRPQPANEGIHNGRRASRIHRHYSA